MQATGAAGAAGAVPPAGGVAAAAGAVAPAGGVGAIAGVPIFARAPAEIVQQGYLDLSDRNQCQIYTNGMKPLQALDADRFDCKEPNLKKFLDAFDHREAHMGWRTLFTITVNGRGRHIPSEWGQVTVQNVSDAMVIVHGTQTLACQNSCMSGHCLWDSINTDARNKVTTYADLYKIDGYKSGPVLLRAIIACTHIDTRAASERVLRDLENLGSVMIQVNSDIAAFNLYVEGKHAELRARGMTDPAATSHLLQGYEAAADEPFVAWIQRHHDNVDDGTATFTADQLMQMASRKYADMMANGTWARPNADQERIIALDAKVDRMKKGFQKSAPKADNIKKPTNQADAPKTVRKEDEWKYVVPAPGAPRTMAKGDLNFHWCMNHNHGKGMWALHTDAECKGKSTAKNDKKPKAKKGNTGTVSVKPTVRFNAADTTIENVSDSD